MIDISIILIVKDELSIRETLLKLYPQFVQFNAECFVVDASHPSLDGVAAEFPWVYWIKYQPDGTSKKATIPEQRNIGVQNSTGRVITFCDAGSTPHENWLGEIVLPILQKRESLVGGPVYATNKESLARWINRQNDGEIIQYPTTANLAMSRDAFELVGGFNEELSYGSDADLVWRLNREGIFQKCVSAALMGLDGGNAVRERKRAWRYGKAMGDLLLLFPEKRKSKFRSNPEIWLYPALIFSALLSCVFAFLSTASAIFFISGIFGLNLFLWIKNGGNLSSLRLISHQYIYGLGLMRQILRRFLFISRSTKVLIYPADNVRYLEELYNALTFEKVDFAPFKAVTPSNTLNLILLPLQSVLLKLRGVRIVHIHWIYRFRVSWSSSQIVRYILQFWFYLWILSLKFVDIKIVWTAHNILPHERIFGNDTSARKFLVRHSDSVVAFSKNAAVEIIELFNAQNIVIIPEGPLFHPSTLDRHEVRQTLKVPEGKILFISLGSLGGYKGIDDIIKISSQLPENVEIRIAGWCSGSERNRLIELTKIAEAGGAKLDVTFKNLSNNEYGGYLKAADYYLAPFKSVTNSGSINAALSSGVPLILTDLDSLEWVPEGTAILFSHDGDRPQNLLRAMITAAGLGESDREEMIEKAKDYSKSTSWKFVAESHKKLYSSMMKKD